MAIKNLIQLRKGSASEWATANPVLASGEPGYDLTNNVIKVGDGVTEWNSLSGIGASASSSGSIDLDTTLVAGTGIGFSYDSTTNSLSINISGQLGLTTEEVDDRVSALLVGGYGIILDYNDNSNLLTISTSGLQPSGDYASFNHTHTSSQITDFNSSVSGLLPVTNIVAGDNITTTNTSGSRTVSVSSSLTDSIFHPFLLGGM